jgi:hypothetical protein
MYFVFVARTYQDLKKVTVQRKTSATAGFPCSITASRFLEKINTIESPGVACTLCRTGGTSNWTSTGVAISYGRCDIAFICIQNSFELVRFEVDLCLPDI